jgi:hypothetical protein
MEAFVKTTTALIPTGMSRPRGGFAVLVIGNVRAAGELRRMITMEARYLMVTIDLKYVSAWVLITKRSWSICLIGMRPKHGLSQISSADATCNRMYERNWRYNWNR